MKVWEPKEPPQSVLETAHLRSYLNKLRTSSTAASEVIELPFLSALPSKLVDYLILRKLRFHAGGTVLAVALAVHRGWAINIGGGMHHASHKSGSGWCPYSDITMAVQQVRAASDGLIRKVMVVDTDAHQGNGYARDKLHFKDSELMIVDVYNAGTCAEIFPGDEYARGAIDIEKRLRCGCTSDEYMASLHSALQEASCQEKPDLVIHNAGSDVLVADPLGKLAIDEDTLHERDMLVWKHFRHRGVPVCMLLSGGYTKQSAGVTAKSLAAIIALEKPS